jgi:hypothetical protein
LSSSAIAGATVLTVTAAELVSIAVSPAAPSIALGTGQQFTAAGTYTDGGVQDLTATVTWSSSARSVATVSNAPGSRGLATSVTVGSTSITATDPGSAIAGQTTVTVTPAVLVSLQVTPTVSSLATGATRQFAATGTFSDGSVQDVTATAAWSSSAPAVATIDNAPGSAGLATGVAAGTTTITATDPDSLVAGATTMTVVADISLRGAASAGATSGVTSLTIATPAGTAGGDVMVAAIALRPHTATITAPAGWTLVRRVDNSATNANSLVTYRRVAVQGEAASHTWSFSSSTGSAGGIATFAGVDESNVVDVHGGQTTANGLSHSAPSVVTSTARTMVFTAHGFSSSATWTGPAGSTEAFDVASDAIGGTGMAIAGYFALQASAGATGVRTAVASNDGDVGNTQVIALRRDQ